mmetsp:Transcript_44597/g.87360  ORF Transcript_44597/g.87360 Transcript_44597/m.87360 type:complete len:133 (+) Transcript_44597:424-822(+)
MKSRSPTSLSRGDLVKRESNLEIARVFAQQMSMSDLPFRPTLSKKSSAAQGVLKLKAQGESFLERVRQKAAVKEAQRQAKLNEKQEEEQKECTFKPKIRESPAFVKDHIRSLEKSGKTRKQKPAQKPKPDWR